jgi:membrane-associated protein
MTTALLGFVLALAETGLGLGALIPGEVAISSIAASIDGAPELAMLWASVALGAISGDHLGLLVGRLGGVRLRDSRLIAKVGLARWDKAADLIRQHGFLALLASRLLPFVRTVMPAVAGAAGVPYRTLVTASVIGAAAWSAVWVGAGAGLAASGLLNQPLLITIVVVAAVLWLLVRLEVRHRQHVVAHRDGHHAGALRSRPSRGAAGAGAWR